MTQAERRHYLITQLLCERPDGLEFFIPAQEQEQKALLRALLNMRMPKPASREFLKVQNAYLQEEIRQKGITSFSSLQPVQPGIYI